MEQSGIDDMDRMTGSSINIANNKEAEEHHCRDIVISIEEMRRELPPPIDPECSIYRVPKQLCNMNRKAYTPQVISIGPFHHRQSNLVATEQHKFQALDSYLRRVNMTVEAVVTKITQNWENKARRCYGEHIKMDNHKFVTMLLLDGCFIVEFLILHYNNYKTQNGLDASFYKAMSSDIYRDITLLENQLPFFVLQDLFDLIPKDETKKKSLIGFLTEDFFSSSMKTYKIPCDVSPQNVKHLVHLFSLYFSPPRDAKKQHAEDGYLFAPSVTKLRDAGVTFEKAEEDDCLMNISFEKGVLKIPPLNIDDHFETIVRNLMAFEHYPAANDHMYTIQYALFMDDLISTETDVRLLVEAGIIINNIGGSDKEVSRLFNDICKYVNISGGFHYFNHIIGPLQYHCNKWWPKSKAALRRDYFNNPWASISVGAATFAIILTLLQTIFTAISTFKENPYGSIS